jgi:hypothetical protein
MTASRRLALAKPLATLIERGSIGVWSANSAARPGFVPMAPVQLALLLQFAAGDRSAADAAAGAGLDCDESLLGLLAAFEAHGLLVEAGPADAVAWHRFHHPDIEDTEPVFLVQPDTLSASEAAAIGEPLSDGALMGTKALSESFAGSHGFAVRLHDAARPVLARLLPCTEMLFDRVVTRSPAFASGALPNAYYINVLAIPPGGGAGLHRDCSLDGVRSADWVSIAYLRGRPAPRGRLFLKRDLWPVGFVHPSPGMAVHFRGDLAHGVTDTAVTDDMRLSFVCEQYRLPADALARVPFLEVVRSGTAAAVG